VSRTAQAALLVALEPEPARELWTDLERWPAFVEGIARVVEVRGPWPAEGAQVTWQSIPGGRGRVSEQVVESSPRRFVTRVSEQALHGTQTASFAEADGGARLDLSLEYELAQRGPLTALSDALFIRRALRDALRRTLRRFAAEADEVAEAAARPT